ncbi:MAG: glycosyltransferase [Myxococcales bacterium]|nr:glycosyltransferase [Myxococcales bacterium]
MKVALVHDWLVASRGGEKVLEAICELFPTAEVFTLVWQPGSAPPGVERLRIRTSFVDRLPLARRWHRHFLPLYPAAVEALDLRGFELIVSSSHCAAKGIRRPEGARHLSYVHAPMRYVWDRFGDYFGPGRASLAVRAAAAALRPWLRAWDVRSARGVDRFVANSHHIARRIAELYGRQAAVVHPPVELSRFTSLPLEGSGRGSYFLWLGALAPYKRADLAVEAFRRLGLPLWLAGSGQDERRIARSLPPNVKLLGQVDDASLPELYRGARALVFTGEEDFGLTPLEAQACGRPVIAYERGGALETVTPATGLFFDRQTPEAVCRAVEAFDSWEQRFDPAQARANAARFSRERFQAGLLAEVSALMDGRR